MDNEEFLSELGKLVEENKEAAGIELVKDFAKGKEDSIAILLMKLGIELENRNNHSAASLYFEFSRNISKSEEIRFSSTELAAIAHFNHGVLLYGNDRKYEAKTEFETAVQLKPDLAEGYCNLGILYVQSGQIQNAIITLEKALEHKDKLQDKGKSISNMLKELRRARNRKYTSYSSFIGIRALAVVVFLLGIFLWAGNISGAFPTCPFAGFITMIAASLIWAAAKR